MTPAFHFFFFLSMTASSLTAAVSGNQSAESLDVSEFIQQADNGIEKDLQFGSVPSRSRRNAAPCTATGCKWPRSGHYVYVPYVISPLYTPQEQVIIVNGLLAFHNSTCIRFVQNLQNKTDHLYFFSGNDCSSKVGRQGGQQKISLKNTSCLRISTVQHEALHALGFKHEHSRSDRDQHVKILENNIKEGVKNNFKKVKTNNLGTPYDFNSVMHYTNIAFSKNGEPTILIKSRRGFKIRKAKQMSHNDITRVNRLYDCNL